MDVFGLIGRSLSHSFSRAYFSEKFAKMAGYEAVYLNFELADIAAFPELISRQQALRGLNVTIPYKEEVIPFLDRLSPEAQRIGAVNTIAFEGNKVVGYNTDVIGFRETVEPLLPKLEPVVPALIFGTGGASRAVAFVLDQAGLAYTFVSRNHKAGSSSYEQAAAINFELPRLLVNTTPLGTYPKTDEAPDFPWHKLGPQHQVIDLVYNPPQTKLMRLAESAGAETCNGLTMLHGQAEAAWNIWRSTV